MTAPESNVRVEAKAEEVVASVEAGGPARLNARRVIIQIVGFALGIGLLVWCIRRAVAGADFGALRTADAEMIAALFVCGFVSILANGFKFWVLIRRVAPISAFDVQMVNCVVNLLNYAPIRLGMVMRVAHHRRVDHLPYVVLLAWYGAIALVAFLVIFALIAATVARPHVDLWWGAGFTLLLVVAMGCIIYVARHHRVNWRLHGAMKMIDRWDTLSWAIVLRVVDVAAYGGRLYIALRIIGVDLEFREWLYLTLLSMVSSLSPVGTLGFREFAIAFFGALVTGDPDTAGRSLQGQLAFAALVDRAAEAALFIPFGIIGLTWMGSRWRRARAESEPRPDPRHETG